MVQDHFLVEKCIAFLQFWSELSSDFKSINAIALPNGNNSRTDLNNGLCPFAKGFWVLHFCLAENAEHRSALIMCVCVRECNALSAIVI